MEHNKSLSPRPNGLPSEWYIINSDMLELFSVLHVGQLDLLSLNFGEMFFLPKFNEPQRIQQYSHICLHNASFKIFTKT
jgi:hypothetical protein